MEIIADLQIHSKYSRAVSNKMDLFEIARWCSRKGIDLAVCGDWTHPLWLAQVKQHLKETTQGIFELASPPDDIKYPVRFMLGTEVSCIYSHRGKVRRVHHLIFVSSLAACDRVILALTKRGAKLASDGRPIIGMSSKDLLSLLLEADSDALLIPAHAWTPWFGLFGSKSGYDSIEECFEEMSPHVYAIETGLSSDPAMNWGIPELDHRSIVSFSDAHSGPKLGREATVFEGPDSGFSYHDIVKAIKQDQASPWQVSYTIEFWPEEGKYHWSGHREHGIRLSTAELKKQGEMCPVCKRPLTVGVEKRVIDLSRSGYDPARVRITKNEYDISLVHDLAAKRRPFVSAVPLQELLQEVYGSLAKATREYERITAAIPEFELLLRASNEDITRIAGAEVAEAIRHVRARRVRVDPGYDGVFGTVHALPEAKKSEQLSLV